MSITTPTRKLGSAKGSAEAVNLSRCMCAGEGKEPVTDRIISRWQSKYSPQERRMCNSESNNYCAVMYTHVCVGIACCPSDGRECKLWVRAVNPNGLCICFREQQINIQYKKYGVLRGNMLIQLD